MLRYRTKKINAFTLAEMLVVLVISSIIITITILVLNLVQGQIRAIQTIYKNNIETRLLERALWQDFNRYQLYFNKSNEQLMGISEKDSVTYIFNQDYIIRNTDTIRVLLTMKTLFLDGNEVNNNEIDAIELQLSKEIKNKKLFIFKRKDATHYLN